jgi:selenocysteine lyase/cysteine desulfurase
MLLSYDVTPGEGAMCFLMGTPNIPAMHGVIESVELINELDRRAIDRHTSGLAVHAMNAADAAGFQTVTVRGEHGPIVTFNTGHSSAQLDALIQSLGNQKIMVGKHLDKQRVPHVRISVHCYNTQEEIDRCFEVLRG